jgi:hypothetical protein
MMSRLLVLPAAAAAVLLAAGTAAAVWPPGTVAVATDGCQYTIHIDLDVDPNPAIVGWEVRAFTSAPFDGALVASGSGAPDAEGRLTVGPLTADPGHYHAIVDDEVPVDASSNIVDFALACEAPTASGSELPISGSPSPTGGEEGIGGTPPPEELPAAGTPPPTDATTAPRAADDGPRAAVLALVGLTAATLFLARTPIRLAVPARRRRDR